MCARTHTHTHARTQLVASHQHIMMITHWAEQSAQAALTIWASLIPQTCCLATLSTKTRRRGEERRGEERRGEERRGVIISSKQQSSLAQKQCLAPSCKHQVYDVFCCQIYYLGCCSQGRQLTSFVRVCVCKTIICETMKSNLSRK